MGLQFPRSNGPKVDCRLCSDYRLSGGLIFLLPFGNSPRRWAWTPLLSCRGHKSRSKKSARCWGGKVSHEELTVQDFFHPTLLPLESSLAFSSSRPIQTITSAAPAACWRSRRHWPQTPSPGRSSAAPEQSDWGSRCRWCWSDRWWWGWSLPAADWLQTDYQVHSWGQSHLEAGGRTRPGCHRDGRNLGSDRLWGQWWSLDYPACL